MTDGKRSSLIIFDCHPIVKTVAPVLGHASWFGSVSESNGDVSRLIGWEFTGLYM